MSHPSPSRVPAVRAASSPENRLPDRAIAPSAEPEPFDPVYGPVRSWRLGRSLGIDPIGRISTCSFDCVYCQLGEIERKTRDRAVYVPAADIAASLRRFPPGCADWVTLSGSGEPTLAANLGEILRLARTQTGCQTAVLTNGTLLGDRAVQQDLQAADAVFAKWDALSADGLRRIDRPVPGPVPGREFDDLWAGLLAFRQQYGGRFAVQTMVLAPWSEAEREGYVRRMADLRPDEIQLNVPSRPRPLARQLDGRGNHDPGDRPYAARSLRCLERPALEALAADLETATGIPVRCAPAPRR